MVSEPFNNFHATASWESPLVTCQNVPVSYAYIPLINMRNSQERSTNATIPYPWLQNSQSWVCLLSSVDSQVHMECKRMRRQLAAKPNIYTPQTYASYPSTYVDGNTISLGINFIIFPENHQTINFKTLPILSAVYLVQHVDLWLFIGWNITDNYDVEANIPLCMCIWITGMYVSHMKWASESVNALKPVQIGLLLVAAAYSITHFTKNRILPYVHVCIQAGSHLGPGISSHS